MLKLRNLFQTALGGYPPPVTQPVVNTTVVLTPQFRDVPCETQCPNCHNHITTSVLREPGSLAWMLCVVMMFLGWWLCCFIPFCVDSLQDADHYCPVCRHRIAHYSQI